MEGKLIKMVEGYTLSLTGSIDDLYGISNQQLAEEHQLHKLSLKNCEVVEHGYDLDELAKLSYKCDPYIAEYLEQEFKKGFQKALEILGDKKFSEEDIKNGMLFSFDVFSERLSRNHIEERIVEYIQSLQQTEFDVKIEMEEKRIGGFKGYGEYELVPKLDVDGCLILKRK